MHKTLSLLRFAILVLSMMLPVYPAFSANAPAITKLTKTDSKVGKGAVAVSGKSLTVHYTGWLYDAAKTNHKGAKFDSSLDIGQPITFPLGEGQMIPGWDKGLVGMKVGGKRTLIIPPDMAYGSHGAGDAIPPNATLIFDVELLKVQ